MGKLDRTNYGIIILIGITSICLMAFVNKAFHIDDPLFLWTARQIHIHPVDFYGFSINWYGWEAPISIIAKNPPLVSYYIAFVSYLFGSNEIILHLAFIIPAIGAILGTYYLAKEFCRQPLVATLIGIFTPTFLLSSTNVMCDVMMLSFWVWAIFFWIRGIRKNKRTDMLISSVFICFCALTKYFGISLIPLLFIYSLNKREKAGRLILFFLIPLSVLVLYEYVTGRFYGQGLLSDAVAYSDHVRSIIGQKIFYQLLLSLSFVGGCLLTALFYTTQLWSRKAILIGSLLFIIIGIVSINIFEIEDINMEDAFGLKWSLILQFSLFIVTGTGIIVLAVLDFIHHRDEVSILLFLWITGTFIFSCFINWAVTGRSILPITPALGILLVRRMEYRQIHSSSRQMSFRYLFPVIPGAIIALSIVWADYTLANTARSAAVEIAGKYKKQTHNLWFQGHWGFQYYMEIMGGKPVNLTSSKLMTGDIVIFPSNNTCRYFMPKNRVELLETIKFVPCTWLTTMNCSVNAGFYSSTWGVLPFAFVPTPTENYDIFLMKQPLRFIRSKK
jgi:4-amino-4-deoxy-L-arabinose transferase-like glycosyltransferase